MKNCVDITELAVVFDGYVARLEEKTRGECEVEIARTWVVDGYAWVVRLSGKGPRGGEVTWADSSPDDVEEAMARALVKREADKARERRGAP